jgi:drug/metabolite transporter (DMT)-like permease
VTLESLHQFLTLYQWFALALLILFVALIARFYERFQQKPTYYRLYAVSVALLGAFAVRDASMPPRVPDPISEALLLLGGGVLLALLAHLARLMLSVSRQDHTTKARLRPDRKP